MKRLLRVVVALTAIVTGLQLAGTVPAFAEVTFTFTPTTGPQGTIITFSGTGCPHTGTRDGLFLLTRDGTTANPVDFTSDAGGNFTGTYNTSQDPPGSYTTIVTCLTTSPATNAVGSQFVVTPPPGGTYVPLPPARVLDTRDATGRPGVAPVGRGQTIDLTVVGVGGVPADNVAAVVLNVTVTNATAASYLTVFPTGTTRPLASNLNFNAGDTLPNLVMARVGAGGKVSIYNNDGNVDVVADVQGWVPGPSSPTVGSTYQPLAPARVLDTRNGTGTGSATPVPHGGTIDLTVAGAGGVPATGVTAVALNVTATNASGPPTYVTVFPSGAARPLASNLNVVPGQTAPNLVIVQVNNGKISLYNAAGTVDLIADVQGWFGGNAGSKYVPIAPVRDLDTRDGTGTGGSTAQLGPGGTIELTVAGVNGVPASGVTAVVLNVAVTNVSGPDSFLTVFPTGTAPPLASNLNVVAGQTVANLVIARVGANGKVSIYNNLGTVDVIADVQGWFA